MGAKGWNIAVLVAIGAIWFAGSTQREKPVVGDSQSARVAALEDQAAASPTDSAKVRELAQGYLDAHAPGMALATIEHAPAAVRAEPTVDHLYARALVEQGRNTDALAAEKRVLERCADVDKITCSSFLIASATRRAQILEELVAAGVDDANAEPLASGIAYHNVTREVRVVAVSSQQ